MSVEVPAEKFDWVGMFLLRAVAEASHNMICVYVSSYEQSKRVYILPHLGAQHEDVRVMVSFCSCFCLRVSATAEFQCIDKKWDSFPVSMMKCHQRLFQW